MNYLDLVQNFQIFVLTHPVLKTFSHGEVPAVNAATRSLNEFPLLNLRLSNVSISTPNTSLTQTITFSIEVTLLDVLLHDRSNEVYILNNLSNIIKDLYSQSFIYNNLINNYIATPGPFYMSENLFGFQLTLDLEFSLGDAFCIEPSFIEGYDTDAINLLIKAGITDTNTINNYNEFVLNLKSGGFWNKFKYLYPLLGTTANSQKWNALNPVDSASAFRLDFNDIEHGSKGFRGIEYTTGAGFATPSAYASTNYNPFVQGSDGIDTTYGVFISEFIGPIGNTVGEDAFDFGAGVVTGFTNMKTRTFGNSFVFDISSDGSVLDSHFGNSTNSRGLYAIWRTAQNATRSFRNGSFYSLTPGTIPFQGAPDSILLLSNINKGSGSTITLTSPPANFVASFKWIGLAFAIDTLTDSEVVSLNSIINNFMTSIGR